MIVIGVDTHKGSHALSAVDEGTGKVRGQLRDRGRARTGIWPRCGGRAGWTTSGCGRSRTVGMCPGRLEQALLAAASGWSGSRRTGWAPRGRAEREPGKSDQIDALAIARAVVKDGIESFPVAFLDEQAMEIRLLLDHRDDLVAERTRTVNRLRWHLLELCPELEALAQARRAQQGARRWTASTAQLRKLPAGACVRIAREQICASAQPQPPDRRARAPSCAELVDAHRPQLLAEQGCGALTAAILIGHTAGNQAVPLRRELRAADRDRADPLLLRATHPAPTQPRRRPATQPRAAHHRGHPRRSATPPPRQYLARKEAEGKTKKGALRCPQAPPRPPLPAAALRAARRPAAGR